MGHRKRSANSADPCLCCSSDVAGPAESASPARLLERQHRRLHPRPAESECALNPIPRCFSARSGLRSTGPGTERRESELDQGRGAFS